MELGERDRQVSIEGRQCSGDVHVLTCKEGAIGPMEGGDKTWRVLIKQKELESLEDDTILVRARAPSILSFHAYPSTVEEGSPESIRLSGEVRQAKSVEIWQTAPGADVRLWRQSYDEARCYTRREIEFTTDRIDHSATFRLKALGVGGELVTTRDDQVQRINAEAPPENSGPEESLFRFICALRQTGATAHGYVVEDFPDSSTTASGLVRLIRRVQVSRTESFTLRIWEPGDYGGLSADVDLHGTAVDTVDIRLGSGSRFAIVGYPSGWTQEDVAAAGAIDLEVLYRYVRP